MEDNLSKFIKIAGLLLLTVIAALTALVILLFGIRFFFGLFGHLSWVTYVFKLVMIALPALLFISVYLIFFRRTLSFASRPVKLFSQSLFIAAILSWIYAYVMDLISFYELSSVSPAAGNSVRDYMSYGTWFVAGHVSLLFLIGIIQALASPPEPDWMERGSNRLS